MQTSHNQVSRHSAEHSASASAPGAVSTCVPAPAFAPSGPVRAPSDPAPALVPGFAPVRASAEFSNGLSPCRSPHHEGCPGPFSAALEDPVSRRTDRAQGAWDPWDPWEPWDEDGVPRLPSGTASAEPGEEPPVPAEGTQPPYHWSGERGGGGGTSLGSVNSARAGTIVTDIAAAIPSQVLALSSRGFSLATIPVGAMS
ncbi:hypothetical protein HS041_00925 [Planomonospora sp. ID67723]|uniref:hypothetical protein n=1 Tax=Planomonospora sp. ID67723 TaxID=2738134 RepID=UPI0018C40363|nr:hypothetical protein [Planomonospora sp. ID67723]MBG0826346.1 hypothetical protein [Planomonospora sp. ID67723]